MSAKVKRKVDQVTVANLGEPRSKALDKDPSFRPSAGRNAHALNASSRARELLDVMCQRGTKVPMPAMRPRSAFYFQIRISLQSHITRVRRMQENGREAGKRNKRKRTSMETVCMGLYTAQRTW